MLKKLIIVYNSRSSQKDAIEREVLAPARKIKGWLVGRYAVKEVSLKENAKQLAKILNDGDLVVAVGGDGTAAMAANGILRSKKDVTFGVMSYGNFNDLAKIFRTKRPVEYGGEYVGGLSEIMTRFEAGKTSIIYPLEVQVDGKLWRYVIAYMTLGMFAESTRVFDETKVRKKLQKGGKHLIFSVLQLAKWYFQNRKSEFIPQGELERDNDKETQRSGGPEIMIDGAARLPVGTTDYLAVNGPRLARVMRGGKWFLQAEGFRSGTARLASFWRLAWFMLRSMFWRVPGKKAQKDVIKFVQPSEVEIQAEGEYERLQDVQEIMVGKSERALKVIRF